MTGPVQDQTAERSTDMPAQEPARHEAVRPEPSRLDERRLDLATRAAWLYYINGATQDEVAAQLAISRQSAQRLVALAVSERLVEFRIHRPVAECAALVERLKALYPLAVCEVVPSGPSDPGASVGVAAAQVFEAQLQGQGQGSGQGPGTGVFGFSTGQALLRMSREIASRARPDLKLISIVGNAARDGCVSLYEIAMRLADRIGARCYPMQVPVVAGSPEHRAMLQDQVGYHSVQGLAAQARAIFVGVSEIAHGSPLQRDGFLSAEEMDQLVQAGGVGEIASWPFDREGRLLDTPVTRCLTALRPDELARSVPLVAVAHGPQKVRPLTAALAGGLLTGLVTDEATARAVLDLV